MQYKTLIFKSILGDVHCIFSGEFLIKLYISKDNHKFKNIDPKIRFMEPVLNSDSSDKIFSSMSHELKLYFSGELREFKQPFKLMKGTPFQQAVWLTLREIPFGETRTYKWLAERLGKPFSYRAVGQTLKQNPLLLILPCHRIIASDGSIGGFACGSEIKRQLLRHESLQSSIHNA